MIIYEFSTWGTKYGELFRISAIEVEEKPKTYIESVHRTRIPKNEINILSRSYGNRMYRLDDNPAPYIEAIIKRKNEHIEALEKRVISEKEELTKWLEAQREIK